MKRVRIERPKRRRARTWLDVLPLDPRDQDVVRAKELLDAASEAVIRDASGSKGGSHERGE